MLNAIIAAGRKHLNTETPVGSQEKISVVKIYNHTLTGNENALIDSNAGHVLLGDNTSDQSFIPAGQNSWWDNIATYLVNPVLITIDNGYSGAFRTSALPPEGINFTMRFNKRYKLKKVCIFLEPKNNGDKGHVIVKTGTPYNWVTTVADLHDDGTLGGNKWFDFDCDSNTTWVNLSVTDKECGIIRDVVFYGEPLVVPDDVDNWTVNSVNMQDYENAPVYNKVGMNIFYGMGQDFDGVTKYDEGWTGGTRTFGAGKYVLQANGDLVHSSGTANALEAAFCDRVINSGGDQYYCYGSLLCSDMAEFPADGSDWANQKPIDVALGDSVNGQRIFVSGQNRLTFNEIAHLPSSYARAAYILSKLAQGNYSVGIRNIEPDNEKDGSFKGAGFMFPEQQAAMMSTYWDGHGNTVTYNSNPVGIRNNPTLNSMKVLSPAFSYISPRYFDCMRLWFETFRSGMAQVYPFDVLSVHAYPGTFEVQFSGTGEAIYPERTDVYNLPNKLNIARGYALAMGGKGVVNTELGFDTYKKVHPHPENGCGAVEWGGSFVAIKPPAFAQPDLDPPNKIQADWLLRSYLMHITYDIPLRMYWLSDQGKRDYACGTFNAAGLLTYDNDNGGNPTYIKKPSYNVIKQFLTVFSNTSYLYRTDVTNMFTLSGGGSSKVQALLLVPKNIESGSNDFYIATWLKSGDALNNISSSETLTLGNSNISTFLNNEYGATVNSVQGYNLDYDNEDLIVKGGVVTLDTGMTAEERPTFYRVICNVP